MPRIGALELDPALTAAKETRERREDGWHRLIALTGLPPLAATAAIREAFLDTLWAAAAPGGDAPVSVSLRTGRAFAAHALRLTRENLRGGGEGAFSALLEALTPWEEAETASTAPWGIAAQGAILAVPCSGTLDAPLTLAFTASGTVYFPSFTDGARTLSFSGTVPGGKTLLLDGPREKAWLDGADVTGQCAGAFPRIGPGPATTLQYLDDPDSSHTGSAALSWRDRWV
ncbi:MAG: hypothetical protein GXY15_08670 [Candidatus Hydrogenedentes bacterium]|nr:hypothetical protein [Candidatus Hydrogenedentota bacterium]